MSSALKIGRDAAEAWLPGLAPQRLDGLFFAIFPDAQAAVRIANAAWRFRRTYRLIGEPLQTRRFHVTLHGFGIFDGMPRCLVEKALNAGAAVTSVPFDVAFDRVTSFAGSNALVLTSGQGTHDIKIFHQSLGAAMRQVGLRASSNFTPHVTLLYDRRRIEEQFIESIRWTVYDFVLVHSRRGRTQHMPLERWQLRQ
jgi:2'-5' RNA ligase